MRGGVMSRLKTLERRRRHLSEERETDFDGMSQQKPTKRNGLEVMALFADGLPGMPEAQ